MEVLPDEQQFDSSRRMTFPKYYTEFVAKQTGRLYSEQVHRRPLEAIMKKQLVALTLLAISSLVVADDVTDSDQLLCSAGEVVVCFEGGECMEVLPWELNVPQFVVVDLKKKTISTTKASGENRSTPIRTLNRDGEAIVFQGIEAGRAFSFTIDKRTGLLTVAVSRDGLTVSVFGACTDTDL
jgi:hypothetical protein